MWDNPKQLNIVSNLLYFIAFLMLAFALVQWVISRPMFILRDIVVEGETQHLSLPMINAGISNRINGNFFTVNLSDVQAVFEQMPWVKQASVRRFWPNQLIIKIDEFKPLGIWNGSQLVSVDGDLFTVNQGEINFNLPKFFGRAEDAVEMAEKYQKISQWIARLDLKIAQFRLSDSHAWSMTLLNGTVVEIGREITQDTLFDRIQRLVAAWPVVTQRWGNQIENVDLRYPNGFAIRASSIRFLSHSDTDAK